MLEPHEILFVGLGRSSVLWYRCALPAMHIGADWVGVQGIPPGVQVVTGLVRGETKLPIYANYKVVVLQQPYGRRWLKQINRLREHGIKVLYEVDDYLHAVAKQPHHDYAKHFTRERVAAHELCMRACDGIICSTDYIARRYARFNAKVFVCRNGLDVARYQLTRPPRPTVNIGWAGATGHLQTAIPWFNAVIAVMREHENTCLVIIGHPQLAAPINQLLGREGALGIPFLPLECYPAAMCTFDIALAPAGDTAWYRGKSDLRWLEAGALGIPTIADRRVYHDIRPQLDGFWAETPEEAAVIVRELIADEKLRTTVGEAARERVHDERSIEVAAAQWLEVCSAVAGEYESMSQLRRAAKGGST